MFNTLLTQPIFNLLVFLYNTIAFNDLGIAIIELTILIKLLLWPLSKRQIKAQKALSKIQPKIKAIQDKYKDNKELQAKKVMEFYQKNKINPLGSCLPLIFQVVIFIGLYQALKHGLNNGSLDELYSFIKNPGELKTISMGFLDLMKSNPVLAITAGGLSFVQTKMLTSKNKPQKPGEKKDGKKDPSMMQDIQNMTSSQMTYLMPAMIILISWSFPAGIPLYWTVNSLFSIGQQYFMLNRGKKEKIK